MKELFERINTLCTDYANCVKNISDTELQKHYSKFIDTIYRGDDKILKNHFCGKGRYRGYSALETYFLTHPSGERRGAHAAPFFASYRWVRDKIYFEFEENLEKQIQDSYIADSEDVPAELLNHLPYSCFFVATRGRFVDWEIEERFKRENGTRHQSNVTGDGVGFFAVVSPHKEFNEVIGNMVNTGDKVLDIIACADSSELNDGSIAVISTSMIIPKDGDMTIREAMIPYAQYGDVSTFSEEEKKLSYQYDMTVLLHALQYILYLCAENNTITPRVLQKPKSWASKKKKSAALVKIMDVSEPKPIIRDYPPKKCHVTLFQETDNESHEGNQKSPHVRRGHWHTYWTGPRGHQVRKLLWINEARIHPELDSNGVILRTKDNSRKTTLKQPLDNNS